MMNISQFYWIGDTYYDKVGFLRAKDCDLKKEKFKQELEKELAAKIELDVRIDIWTHFMRECIINYVH